MAYDYNLSYDENRQDWRIDLWMAKHGVTASDFDEHPQIDDVIKMINISPIIWKRKDFRFSIYARLCFFLAAGGRVMSMVIAYSSDV